MWDHQIFEWVQIYYVNITPKTYNHDPFILMFETLSNLQYICTIYSNNYTNAISFWIILNDHYLKYVMNYSPIIDTKSFTMWCIVIIWYDIRWCFLFPSLWSYISRFMFFHSVVICGFIFFWFMNWVFNHFKNCAHLHSWILTLKYLL